MENNKKIIIATLFLLLASAVYLAWTEKRQADLDLNKNWWTLAFADPKSSSLSFSIENHSDKSDFHWQILADNKKIQEGDAKISKSLTWTSDVQVTNLAGKNVIISVSNGADKKEIYKNLAE